VQHSQTDHSVKKTQLPVTIDARENGYSSAVGARERAVTQSTLWSRADLNGLVDAGTQAIGAYEKYLEDCLIAAQDLKKARV
jgi:hypothetical protein